MTDSLVNITVGAVNQNAAAVLILEAGQSALLVNPSGTVTVWYGNNPALTPDYQNAIPLLPNSYVGITARQDVYACTQQGIVTQLQVLPGGQTFFQPTTLSGLGGVKVFIQATAPVQPPTIPANSIWLQVTGGIVTGFYTWTGSAWSAQAFNASEIIAAGTIVANLIAANTITAAQIAANTITAAQIQANSLTSSVIGNLGLCLNSNPFMSGGSVAGWAGSFTPTATSSPPAGFPVNQPYALEMINPTGVASSFAMSNHYQVIPGGKYIITGWIYNTGAQGDFVLGSNNFLNGTFVNSTNWATITLPSNTATFFSDIITVPASGYDQMGIYFSFAANGGNPYTVYGSAIQVFPQVQGIVDATTITGAYFVGVGSGNEVLIYTGTPANGNIYGSISAMNDTDGYSNTIHDGFVSYSPGSSTTGYAQLAVNQSSNIPYLILNANGVTSGNLLYPFQVYSFTNNSGTVTEQYFARIGGPVNDQQQDQAYIDFFSSSENKANAAGARVYYADANGGQNLNISCDYSGTEIYVAKLVTAVQPGSGTSPTNPATVEPWHTATLANGWASSGTCRYRLNALGRVEIEMNVNGASATSSHVFTLPAAYFPPANVFIPGSSVATTDAAMHWVITNGGVVEVQGYGSAFTGTYIINASFSLT